MGWWAGCRLVGLLCRWGDSRSPSSPPAPSQGVTFACINAAAPGEDAPAGKGEGQRGEAGGEADSSRLATFALRIKAPEALDHFVAAVNEHKAGPKKGEAAPDP